MNQTVDERIAAITARTADLALAAKQFKSAAEAAKADAAAIRLEKVKKAVDSLSGAVHSLKHLAAELTDGPDAGISAKVQAAIDSLKALREAVDGSA